ncbi:unnamed protein product [Pleuronectes platessa]|uniref:Uncharacterized protein n=1 Tax=Pleuronectes platessa TaxID=8262 RepID=A0A9N7URP3_PLEPL|nr:unnamed protein product [Pleuronectes platessa]
MYGAGRGMRSYPPVYPDVGGSCHYHAVCSLILPSDHNRGHTLTHLIYTDNSANTTQSHGSLHAHSTDITTDGWMTLCVHAQVTSSENASTCVSPSDSLKGMVAAELLGRRRLADGRGDVKGLQPLGDALQPLSHHTAH